MTGFVPITSGEVMFNNRKINNLRPDAVCRIGMVRTWQRVKPLSSLSVVDNVMVGAFAITGSAGAARKIAVEKLAQVGLSDYSAKLAGSLSIGLKKKLELARVLATRPKMLLLDEICGGLNHTETASILQLIRDVREEGTTILFIEHDMKAVTSICERIVVLNSGVKLAEGTPAEITSNPEVIAAYLGGGFDA